MTRAGIEPPRVAVLKFDLSSHSRTFSVIYETALSGEEVISPEEAMLYIFTPRTAVRAAVVIKAAASTAINILFICFFIRCLKSFIVVVYQFAGVFAIAWSSKKRAGRIYSTERRCSVMENHSVTIDNRKKLTITDVKEIESFDEDEIKATLTGGGMIVKGEDLNVQLLDLEEGKAVISGRINSLMYVKVKEKGGKGFIARIMK